MTQLDTQSMIKLEDVDSRLKDVVLAVNEIFPCIVVEGYRDEACQNADVAAGRSKLSYPHSKHNLVPSLAVDISPRPYDPNNKERLLYFAGYVMAVGFARGLKLRWGGAWDGSQDPSKNHFPDLFHFEIDA